MHWKIGEFSRFTRVSVKMLRHYDELGLLRPAAVDPQSGYRYYLAEQLPRLNRLLALKDLGFSLEQVALLLDDVRPAAETTALLSRRAEILAHLRQEQQRLTQLDARLRSLADQSRPGYDVVLRPVDALLVATIRAVLPSDGTEIAALFDEAETFASKHGARDARSPLMLLHDRAANERDVEVAVPLTHALLAAGRVMIRELPAVRSAACVVYRGSYNQTGAALRAISSWVEATGMRADGPPREVYLRFGADGGAYRILPAFLSDMTEEYVTEVQLPVRSLP